MATITSLTQSASATTTSTRYWKSTPVLHSVVIDFAEALVAKGSALAAADVIEAIRVPAGSYILQAGLQTIAVDDATTLTLDVGSADPDLWVDGYDQAAAVAGAYAALVGDGAAGAGAGPALLVTASDTIDVTLATLTGTLTVGKVRVWAIISDVSGHKAGALAQVGD